MRTVEKVVFQQEGLHIVLLLPDFACQIHFKAVVLVIFGEVSEHLVGFRALQVAFASHVPQVAVEHLTGVGGECLSGLLEHPLDLPEHLEFLAGGLGLGHLPLEEFVGVPSHQDALLVADGVHDEVDDFALALLEVVKGGERGTDRAVQMVVVVPEDLRGEACLLACEGLRSKRGMPFTRCCEEPSIFGVMGLLWEFVSS